MDRMERFLLELANVGVAGTELSDFVHRFAEFIPAEMLLRIAEDKAAAMEAGDMLAGRRNRTGKLLRLAVLSLSTKLRAAWDAPDGELREWRLTSLRREMDGYLRSGLSTFERDMTLPTNAFEEAMRHFRAKGNKARRCPIPDCETPYFFASKTTERYCSGGCRELSKRQSKRRSWKKHGRQWRKNTNEAHRKEGEKRTR